LSEFGGEAFDHTEMFHTFKAYRERLGRYRLLGSKCRNCGQIWFPRRHGVCGKCNSNNLEDYQCAQEGTVTEFTIKDNPYTDLTGTHLYGSGKRVIAIVRLNDGPYVFSQVEDCPPDKIRVGMKVRMVLRKWLRESNSNWQYGFRFVPT